MGILIISCPETQRAISTGMQADYETFHSTPVFFRSHILSALPCDTRMVCRECLGLRLRICEFRP
jgi:hypothetical protein